VGFGDGFDTIPDPENARAGYAMSQGGYLFRYDLDTGEARLIRPAPHAPDIELRFNWDAGFALDPFDPSSIYFGSQFLHKSTDRGETWSVISDDLTSNDPDKQTYRTSGGLTSDVTAAENYTSIVVVAPSELEQGLIWVGTDDGRVHLTRDGGAEWTRVDERARGGPEGAWVPMITPSAHDAGTAFVVFDGHRNSDMQPWVYRVEDYGRKWMRLGEGQLSGYALSVLQDYVDPDLLFVGTEFGLFVSVDGGGEWTRFTAGVPTVSVMDMAIQQRESDLVLGTHGRSAYVIDDFSGLRGISENDFGQRLKILSTTTGQHYDANPTASTRFTGAGEFRGDNPPYGVLITFVASGDDLPHPDEDRERDRKIAKRQVQAAAAETDSETENGQENGKKNGDKPTKVTVTVSDSNGDVIRTFKRPVHQGINRISWNLRVDGVRRPPGPRPPEPDADLPSGPEVAPGDFRISLSLGDDEDSADVSTAADPRSTLNQSDYEARFAAQMDLLRYQEAVVASLERIDRARSDVKAITTLLGRQEGEDETVKALKKQAGEVKTGLDELEKRFRNLPKTKGIVYSADKIGSVLGNAQYYLGSTQGTPTSTALEYVDLARRAVQGGVIAVNDYMNGEVAALKVAVDGADITLLGPAEPVAMPD
jgi:hypothetical protein